MEPKLPADLRKLGSAGVARRSCAGGCGVGSGKRRTPTACRRSAPFRSTGPAIGTTLAAMTSGPAPAQQEVLVCPECRARYAGSARIGNRKSSCGTCNRYAQAVRRYVARDLALLHPLDAQRLRQQAEREVYALVVGSTEGSTERRG